jgi:hypothetical protein
MTFRRRNNPVAWLVGLLALVAVLDTLFVIERLAEPLLVLTSVTLVVWRVTRQGRRALPPRPLEVLHGLAEEGVEVIRLRAEVAQLRADLADAREAAHAAWQDASEPGGSGVTVVDLRTRLLSDPRSGAHSLGVAGDPRTGTGH